MAMTMTRSNWCAHYCRALAKEQLTNLRLELFKGQIETGLQSIVDSDAEVET